MKTNTTPASTRLSTDIPCPFYLYHLITYETLTNPTSTAGVYKSFVYIRSVSSSAITFFVRSWSAKVTYEGNSVQDLKWDTGYREHKVTKDGLKTAPVHREYFELVKAAYNPDNPEATKLALKMLNDFAEKDTRYDHP